MCDLFLDSVEFLLSGLSFHFSVTGGIVLCKESSLTLPPINMSRDQAYLTGCQALLALELLISALLVVSACNLARIRGLTRVNATLIFMTVTTSAWIVLLVPQTMAQFEAVDKLMQMEAIAPVIDAGLSAEYKQWDDRNEMYGKFKAIVFAFATFSYVSLVLWRFKLTASSVPIWVTRVLFVFAVVIHVISVVTYAYFIVHPESAYYNVAEITAALLALFTLAVDNLLSWTFMQSVIKISRFLNTGVDTTDLRAQSGGGMTTKKSAFPTVFTTKRTEAESDSDEAVENDEPEPRANTADTASFLAPPAYASAAAGGGTTTGNAFNADEAKAVPNRMSILTETGADAFMRPSPSVSTALRTEDQEGPSLLPSSSVAAGAPAPVHDNTGNVLGFIPTDLTNQDVEGGSVGESQSESQRGRGRQRSTASRVALAGAVQSGRRALWLLGLLCVVSFADLITYGVQLKVTDPYNKILLHVVAGLGPLLQAACFIGFLIVVRLFLETRFHS
ncbi:hypothetical protein BDZ88DRAFT_321220 [Geranomyces variabilis]|nr:hypothetical protein BDZ88DRAFT_321220 [Geranomyces variabilis]KAJ3132529.1 hypothetical protein HDU90_006890 [Geranomyces variabilis]